MLGKNAVLEIVGGQNSLLVRVCDDVHQAFLLPNLEVLVFPHVPESYVILSHEPGHIIDWDILVSPHRDSLEVLRSHDSAYPGPSGIAAPVGVDTGEIDHLLAADTDGSDMDSMGAQPLLDHSFSFQTAFALQFRHGKDRCFTVLYEKDG